MFKRVFSKCSVSDIKNGLKGDGFIFGLIDAIETDQPKVLLYLLFQDVLYQTAEDDLRRPDEARRRKWMGK